MIVLLSMVAAAGFFAASILGILGIKVGPALRSMSVSVAAGILMALAFVELLPESFEHAGHRPAAIAFLAGFTLLFLVELLTRGHTHHAQDGHDDVHSHKIWPFVVGLAIHNLSDGFAIGSGAETGHETGLAITGGVLVHQLPVGLSVAAVLAASHVTRRFVVLSAAAMACAIPVGALSVALIVGAIPETSIATLAAAAAGALTYIATSHLLPEAHAERVHLPSAAVFPAVLTLTSVLLFSTH